MIFVIVVDKSHGLRAVAMSTESLLSLRNKSKILNHIIYIINNRVYLMDVEIHIKTLKRK